MRTDETFPRNVGSRLADIDLAPGYAVSVGAIGNEWRFLFDRALQLRDSENLVEAERLLQQLVESMTADNGLSRAAVQLAYVQQQQGKHAAAIATSERAVAVAPRRELASMGLFVALVATHNYAAAIAETRRLLELRESIVYRVMLETLESPHPLASFTDDVAACRQLLAAHAARQLREPPFSKGHTVRIHDHAPQIFRPARLAKVARNHSATEPEISIRYSDGQRAEIPSDLLSYGTV